MDVRKQRDKDVNFQSKESLKPDKQQNNSQTLNKSLPAPFNALHPELQKKITYKSPTEVQEKAIPEILKGNDVCAVAKTGQGKTAAYALPTLNNLLNKPQALHTLVLAPARELALQIASVFTDFAGHQGLRVACLVGGVDVGRQQLSLAQKPHVIVGTPGRVLDHLKSTKGFSLNFLKFLILDECDKLLAMDFEHDVNEIAEKTAKNRKTLLFTATYSPRVQALEKRLANAVLIKLAGDDQEQVNSELEQLICICNVTDRFSALLVVLERYETRSLVFCNQINEVKRVCYALKHQGFAATAIHGDLGQVDRVSALRDFASGQAQVLVATDVAGRGLDVPAVRLVINYNLPLGKEDYVHRVGRTARAGARGMAVSLVTRSDVGQLQSLEKQIGVKMDVFKYDRAQIEEKRNGAEVALQAADDVIKGRRNAEDIGV